MPSSPRALWMTALCCWCACVALGLAAGSPLTPDEAAYALLARGTSEAWVYRPIGLVVVGKAALLVGDSELALRLPCAITSPLLLVAVHALGKRFGPWTGAGAAALITTSHQFAMRAPELLNDVPSTTCLLGAIVVIVDELTREDGPRYRLVWVAPLLAAALYLRYGSAPVIAIIGVAAIAIWPAAVRARPGPVIATVAALAALLVPFAIYSVARTGELGGVLAKGSELATRKYIGDGLWHFVRNNPFRQYGALLPPVMVLGLALAIRPPAPERRVVWFLALVAVGQIVAIGLVSHASTRMIFLAISLLCVLGVAAIERSARWPRLRCASGIVCVIGCLVMVTIMVPIQRGLTRGLAPLVTAARAIRADAAGRPCTVIARAVPQLMWYSGCGPKKIKNGDEAVELAPGTVWYAANTPRRPVDATAIAAASHATAIALPAPGVWRLEPR